MRIVMDALVSPPLDLEIPGVYRCARCGVESPERTCFVVPERRDKPPHDVRCITCERSRLSTTATEGALGLLRASFIPVLMLVMLQRGLGDLTMLSLVSACLMGLPAIVAHELGHALTARLVGLEVGTIVIGVGPRLWRGEIFRTAVTMHAWPLSGLTFLGSRSMEFLRSRLWIATLMGPLTNMFLALMPALFWNDLVRVLGVPILSLWVLTNAILALQSLMPRRFQHGGETLKTDGLALLQIPQSTPEQLESYLFTAPLLRAFSRFEGHDHAGARAICLEALERTPDNVHLRVLLAACHSYLADPRRSLDILRPLLRAHANAESPVRAAIENSMAFALLMSDPKAADDSVSLAEADRLSANVLALYPCVLAYRSTRALVLAATGRAEQALALLEYSHYHCADRTQRGHREAARAFALQTLDRVDEAERAAAKAMRLNAETAPILRTLGLSCYAQTPANSSPSRDRPRLSAGADATN